MLPKALTIFGWSERTQVKEQKTTSEDALAELVELLEQVDLVGPLAKLNETTISDNNGGRIEL